MYFGHFQLHKQFWPLEWWDWNNLLMWLANYCEAGRLTFVVSSLQMQIQELHNVKFKISLFVCNNQALTIT